MTTASLLFADPLTVIAPLILGVPHIVSDIHYLFLSESVSKPMQKRLITFGVFLLCSSLFLDSSTFMMVGISGSMLSLNLTIYSGIISIRNLQIIACVLILLVLITIFPNEMQRIFVLGHNCVAIVIWFKFISGKESRKKTFLLTLLLSLITIWSVTSRYFLSFAIFLQLMHYYIWLYLIPLSNRSEKKVKRSWHLLAGVILSIFIILSLTTHIPAVEYKDMYLRLFQFHVFLEIMVLTYFYAREPQRVVA
jgi:hypothetical protein